MTTEKEVALYLQHYLGNYLQVNRAARTYYRLCEVRQEEPMVDHLVIRCNDIALREKEFLALGYTFAGRVDHTDEGWWRNMYRWGTGAELPAIFIEQDTRISKSGMIAPWVALFGDQSLHHIAVRVKHLEAVKMRMEEAGIVFARMVDEAVGDENGSILPHIFTVPEIIQGHPFSTLALIEVG